MKRFVRKESGFTPEDGWIEGCVKDEYSITSDWVRLQELISGVKVKEIKNVPKDNGYLTEIFRADWGLDSCEVRHVFQIELSPHAISAWHAHRYTTDRLFTLRGSLKVVLFDARRGSATYNLINEFRLSPLRPTLIVVPPGVWHGIQNISEEPSCLINLADRPYAYEDPDHWRLPPDTQSIPYSFA